MKTQSTSKVKKKIPVHSTLQHSTPVKGHAPSEFINLKINIHGTCSQE